jgi:hypothetical protein
MQGGFGGCLIENNRNSTECTAKNGAVQCESSYKFRVTEVCQDPDANSEPSDETFFSAPTPAGDGCLSAATAPTAVSAFNPTDSSLQVNWTKGESGNCEFSTWGVKGRVQGSSTIFDVVGCQDVFKSRDQTNCTAQQLDSYTYYEFAVREICTDANANSVLSEWCCQNDEAVRTEIVRMEAAVNLMTQDETPSSMRLTWETVASKTDCEFVRWLVERRVAGSGQDGWLADPPGCANVEDECAGFCVLTQLPSLTKFEARVQAVCTDPLTSSDYSEPSDGSSSLIYRQDYSSLDTRVEFASPTMTKPVASGRPGKPNTEMLLDNFTITWRAGDISDDCNFRAWKVEVKSNREDTFRVPIGCAWNDESVPDDKRLKYRENTFCTAQASCGTGYVARVTELCDIADADSLVSETSIEKQTFGGDDCLVQASAPSNLQIPVLDIKTTEVKVEWVPSPIGTMASLKPPGSVPDDEVIMCYPDCLKDTYPACVFTSECDLGTDLATADISPFCPQDAASNPPECSWNYECNFTSYKVEQKEVSETDSTWTVAPSCGGGTS